ncbi:hypothetical protein SLS62_009474 [Diatrype stigma]|uniref:Ysc84 actin-binding domain-containing protein n=1 Tax=Diatrype stigma TaxID=117547 RepID=A0AAN9UDA6_9PEZI
MRSGLWTAGSGGSGILIARKTDGSWSPPSGLMLQTPSLGFVLGVDIYDCILVINNFHVLETFARQKFTLGTDVSLTAGPLVSLGLLENDLRWADLSDTVITYVKAKGQLAEIKLDGTVLSERADENERFYGMKLGVPKILAGDINQSLPQTRQLTEMLKAAEGRTDYDAALVEQLSAHPAPSDATIESPTSSINGAAPSFGIPEPDDPDPFGVVALEMAGLEIREAGSRLRPESSVFDFNPSPSSPIFPRISRRSVDTFVSRSNRGSYMSSKTIATERSQMTDAGTQTFNSTPETTPSQSEDGNLQQLTEEAPVTKEPEEVDYTKIDLSSLRKLSNFPDIEEKPTTTITTIEEGEGNEDSTDHDETSKDAAVSMGESPAAAIEEVPTKDDATSDGDDASQDEADAKVEADVDANADADDEDADDDDDDDEEFEDAEDAVVFEVVTAPTPQRMTMSQGVSAKGAVVTIPRRVPPPLPARSPARSSRQKSQLIGEGMVSSPLRQEFDLDPENEDTLTASLQYATPNPIERSNSDITVIQSDEAPASGQEDLVVEQPAMPTTELQDADEDLAKDSVKDSEKGTEMDSIKVEDRSSKRESDMVQASSDADEQANMASSHGVQVTVA